MNNTLNNINNNRINYIEARELLNMINDLIESKVNSQPVMYDKYKIAELMGCSVETALQILNDPDLKSHVNTLSKRKQVEGSILKEYLSKRRTRQSSSYWRSLSA